MKKFLNAVKYQYCQLLPIIGLYMGFMTFCFFALFYMTKIGNKGIVIFPTYIFSALLFFSLEIIFHKKNLRFLVQNGVSRQLYHYSFLLTLPIVVIVVLEDLLLYMMACNINECNPFVNYSFIEMIFMMVGAYVLAFSLGRLVALSLFKLNALGKIVFTVLLPLALFLLVTSFSANYPRAFSITIELIFSAFRGCKDLSNPGHAINIGSMLLLLSAIILSFCHLSIKNANVTCSQKEE